MVFNATFKNSLVISQLSVLLVEETGVLTTLVVVPIAIVNPTTIRSRPRLPPLISCIRCIYFWCLTPLSAIFQLYHGDQFQWWKKPKYPERTTDHGEATGNLHHLRLRVECTLFCNLQNRARTHAVLVIGLHVLSGNQTT